MVHGREKSCGCVKMNLPRAGKIIVRCERHRGKPSKKRLVCHFEEYESAGRPPCSSCLMRLREAIAGRRPTDLDDISPSDLGDGMEATVEPGAAMTEAELDAFYPAKRQEDG